MIIDVKLQNFRSYENFELPLSPSSTAIIGPNGSGKTNILEAIYVVLLGKSFRGDDLNLIKNGSDWARVDLTDDQANTYSVTLDARTGDMSKTFLHNGEPSKKPFFSVQPVVLFEPDQLRILHGPPDLRRAFLDELASISEPSHQKNLKDYSRALRQRNALLKQPSASADAFFVWDIKLAEYGARIVAARRAVLESINKVVTKNYQAISGTKDSIKLNYKSPATSDDYASWLTSALKQAQDRDSYRGFTSVGPHREDFVVLYNDELATTRVSRGESRSIFLSLKQFELSLHKNPLILYDDVTSELDDARSNKLHLERYQSLITSVHSLKSESVIRLD